MPEPTPTTTRAASMGPQNPTTRSTTMTDDQTTTDDVVDLDTDEPQEIADDLDDVTQSDYDTAAETLASEAASAQDDHAEPVDLDAEDGTPREQRYRARAHTAEAERDVLTGLVDGMRRAEVERLAAPRLADPSDVFRDGAKLGDVLDAEGRVDPGKLGALIDALIGRHPHWQAPTVRYGGPLFSGATNMRQVDTPAKGFADAFGPQAD